MSSWKAWVQRLSGLIKMEGCASAFNGNYLVTVENVSQERVSITDLKPLSYILTIIP